MDTDQARAILRANEAKQRALLNLENAARMSTDDPRSEELLEKAGDAYAKAEAALRNVNLEAVPILMPDGTLVTHGRGELGPVGSGEETSGDPEGPLSSPEAAAASKAQEDATGKASAERLAREASMVDPHPPAAA